MWSWALSNCIGRASTDSRRRSGCGPRLSGWGPWTHEARQVIDCPQVALLNDLLGRTPLAAGDLIVDEVLQGLRDDRPVYLVRRTLATIAQMHIGGQALFLPVPALSSARAPLRCVRRAFCCVARANHDMRGALSSVHAAKRCVTGALSSVHAPQGCMGRARNSASAARRSVTAARRCIAAVRHAPVAAAKPPLAAGKASSAGQCIP